MISTKALRASLTPMLKVCDRAIDTLTARRSVIDNQLAAVQLTREALKLGDAGGRHRAARRTPKATTTKATTKTTTSTYTPRTATARRHAAILAYLGKRPQATVGETAKAIKADAKLVSRWMGHLCDAGKLTKVAMGRYTTKGA
jgi:hypothetical protein